MHVRDIVNQLATHSPSYARRMGDQLLQSTRVLATEPRYGSMVPEFDADWIREVLVTPYRVIYVIRGEVCEVAAVIHGSRDLRRIMRPEQRNGD